MKRSQQKILALSGVLAATLAALVMVSRLEPPEHLELGKVPVHNAGILPDPYDGRVPIVPPEFQFDDIPDPVAPPPSMPKPVQPHSAPTLYIVLDDAGHSLDDLRAFVPFRGRFTVAVLPHLPASSDSARMAAALGHDVILHLPMEPVGSADPGPGAIFAADSDAVIAARLDAALRSVPGAIGVNNHMGSRATSDEHVMSIVMRDIAQRGLSFLDSRTSSQSLGARTAAQFGLPPLQRDVFLDNVRTPAAIRAQFAEAKRVAQDQGYAVLIGHVPSRELARVMIDLHDQLIADGFLFGGLSELLSHHHYVAARR